MPRIRDISPCALILFSLFGFSRVPAAVVHVPDDHPTIQAGIDHAASGDTVLVAAGTYFEVLQMKGGVNLRSETGQADCATIDGTRAESVVWSTSQPGKYLIEGFTITRGREHVMYFHESEVEIRNCVISDNYDGFMGGGVYGRDSILSFFNCTISDNWTEYYGGGLYVHGASSLVMENCRISGNTTDRFGGGLYVNSPASFSGCIFEGNSAGFDGGGVWCFGQQTYDTCTFTDNFAQLDGGGVFTGYTGTSGYFMEFLQCEFSGNSAIDGSGGGICGDGEYILDECRISGNSAVTSYGGGLACRGPASIRGCLIDNNSAGNSGGGMYCFGTDSIAVEHCTIVENSAVREGGGIYSYSTGCRIFASLIAFSTDGEGVACYGHGSALEVGLSNVFGNQGGDQLCGIDLGGNFSADPLFCEMTAGDYSLNLTSPCLIGVDPHFFVIGAMGPGNCTVSAVDDPEMVSIHSWGSLGQNHPNPFNPRTVIPFDMKDPGRPVLRIFDLAGRRISTLTGGEYFPAGRSEATWDGRDDSGNQVPSGVYFYRLDVAGFSETRRMVLMK